MRVIYRISDNGYVKPKLPNATKKHCLLNALVQWPLEEFVVLVDKVIPETRDFLTEYADVVGLNVQFIEGGSSAQSFRIAYEYAINNFADDEVVYLMEDDYLHCDYSRRILLEGIERADYVALYTAPDKFYYEGQVAPVNQIVWQEGNGGETTVVIRTPSSYWQLTNSTTCTFASTVKVLKEDYETWASFCFPTKETTHPNDFPCFLKLREQGRSLIMPLPTLATHCDANMLALDVDWSIV